MNGQESVHREGPPRDRLLGTPFPHLFKFVHLGTAPFPPYLLVGKRAAGLGLKGLLMILRFMLSKHSQPKFFLTLCKETYFLHIHLINTVKNIFPPSKDFPVLQQKILVFPCLEKNENQIPRFPCAVPPFKKIEY